MSDNQTVDTLDNTSLDQQADDFDLEKFESELFNPESKSKDTEKEPRADDSNDDNEDTIDEGDSEPVEDDEDTASDEKEEKEAEKPKRKESRAEKRIRELIAQKKELERRLREKEQAESESSLNDFDNTKREQQAEKQSFSESNMEKEEEEKAPHWDDLDEEGNPKYPLGQFDPKFNADLVKYTIRQETLRIEKEKAEQERRRAIEEAEAALRKKWEADVSSALERYPDFREKSEALIDQFENLEPDYAKFLANTIRSLDNGADVLYYLSLSPDEAKEIVSKGPAMAAVYLGRISAKLDLEDEEIPTKKAKTAFSSKITNAPKPPPRVKGSGVPKVRDLDDLEELERALWGGGNKR